jgi:CRP-like cAMP-binding protein
MLEQIGGSAATRGKLSQVHTRRFRKGETLIRAGSEVHEWIAISKGAVFLSTSAAADAKVAVATLWFGDSVGRGSPLGATVASYDVTALVDVETVALPTVGPRAGAPEDVTHLHTATAARLNRQIAVRLAGNGPQRLISVLATLGSAMFQGSVRANHSNSLAIPVGQGRLGELAGLSRRQAWTYIGELASAGWIETWRTRVVLQALPAWLLVHGEVDGKGLSCISTIGAAIETLTTLNRKNTGF